MSLIFSAGLPSTSSQPARLPAEIEPKLRILFQKPGSIDGHGKRTRTASLRILAILFHSGGILKANAN
jgi:hypothetical protein